MKNNQFLSEQELQVQILREVKDIKEIMREGKKGFTSGIGYIDSADVMKELKISPKTLWNWRQQGLLRGEKIGGKFYFKLSDIQQMMNDHFSRN